MADCRKDGTPEALVLHLNAVSALKVLHVPPIEKIGSKKSTTPPIDKLAEQILKDFKVPAARQKQYSHRLRYGLNHYFARHFHTASRYVLDEQ